MGVIKCLFTLPFIPSHQGRGHLILDTLLLAAGWFICIGISFLSPCRGGPPWSDFREISCFRCKVPQTDAIDQSTIKSGLGQGIYDARHCGFDKSNPYRSAPKVRYVQKWLFLMFLFSEPIIIDSFC